MLTLLLPMMTTDHEGDRCDGDDADDDRFMVLRMIAMRPRLRTTMAMVMMMRLTMMIDVAGRVNNDDDL
eukprot:scaffold403025_cov19-Prasinocladus_malaysianus.AAC.1